MTVGDSITCTDGKHKVKVIKIISKDSFIIRYSSKVKSFTRLISVKSFLNMGIPFTSNYEKEF